MACAVVEADVDRHRGLTCLARIVYVQDRRACHHDSGRRPSSYIAAELLQVIDACWKDVENYEYQTVQYVAADHEECRRYL